MVPNVNIIASNLCEKYLIYSINAWLIMQIMNILLFMLIM